MGALLKARDSAERLPHIELREVTDENFTELMNLEARPGQTERVASNLWSLAQAKVNRRRQPYALYHIDTLVGFVMFDGTAREPGVYYISRLMIAKAYQGREFARAAMVEVIHRMKEKPDCQEIRLDYTRDNVEARSLYRSLGFEEIGKTEAGTVLARLRISAR